MTISRREFLKGSAAAVALSVLCGPSFAAGTGAEDVDKWVKGVCRY